MSLTMTIGWALQMPSRRHIWCHIRLPWAAFCWITFLGERFLSPFCKPVDYKTINSGDLLHSHRLQNRKLNKREKTKTPVSLTNQFRIQGLGTPTTHMPGSRIMGGWPPKWKCDLNSGFWRTNSGNVSRFWLCLEWLISPIRPAGKFFAVVFVY